MFEGFKEALNQASTIPSNASFLEFLASFVVGLPAWLFGRLSPRYVPDSPRNRVPSPYDLSFFLAIFLYTRRSDKK